MSRKASFENLSLEAFEAPMVYKPYETIMYDIKDTVEIFSVIKPLYNFKAKESGVKTA